MFLLAYFTALVNMKLLITSCFLLCFNIKLNWVYGCVFYTFSNKTSCKNTKTLFKKVSYKNNKYVSNVLSQYFLLFKGCERANEVDLFLGIAYHCIIMFRVLFANKKILINANANVWVFVCINRQNEQSTVIETNEHVISRKREKKQKHIASIFVFESKKMCKHSKKSIFIFQTQVNFI